MAAPTDKRSCSRCGQTKPLSEFYRDRRKPDGREYRCKKCSNRRARKWQRANPGKVAAADKKWFEQNRERKGRTHKRYRERNREKVRARHELTNAVRDGKLVKPTSCSRCGRAVPRQRLEAHHEDYSKPLEVEWLCSTCHGAEHRQEVTQ